MICRFVNQHSIVEKKDSLCVFTTQRIHFFGDIDVQKDFQEPGMLQPGISWMVRTALQNWSLSQDFVMYFSVSLRKLDWIAAWMSRRWKGNRLPNKNNFRTETEDFESKSGKFHMCLKWPYPNKSCASCISKEACNKRHDHFLML